ncbi:hypothetical protein DPMN_046144 [Dreissena polymorpha]|uniref:Uncharacterized protein n=1 Tax=Dreissena polymorpha TaxID=45954 RepID=A0A9D4I0L5_DREPO|nr:hypothetical protein DPMN_046144 [Dreissena polymorpha]
MLISFCDISCVNGYNTDDESRILGPCRLYCEISDLVPNIDSPFCDRRCLVDQCNNGCSMYHMAVSERPCLSVCDNWMRENQTDVGRSPNSVIQLKVQTCTRGCGIGLEEFYKSVVGSKYPM